MAKRDQKNAEIERHAKLIQSLTTLRDYLIMFSEYFRQDISDSAIVGYEVALKHLSSKEIKLGCEEALRTCKFFPKAAEIEECLHQWRMAQPGFSATQWEDEPMTDEQKLDFNEGMKKLWAQLEEHRKKPAEPKKILTELEREARQASYFGYEGKWTQERMDKILAKMRKPA